MENKETLDRKLENIVSKETSKFWVESDERVKEKEKPKQDLEKKTLEEVANQYAKNRFSPKQGFPEEDYYISFLSYRAGAKWQQERMYSEEEVIELLEKRDKYLGNWLPPKKWFEQFKNK